MKAVFSPYWYVDKKEDLLGYPHGWVGERYALPLRELKQQGALQGIDLYGNDFGDYRQADIFFFWDRPRADDEVFRFALQSDKPMVLLATEPSSTLPMNADPCNKMLFDQIFCWYGETGLRVHRIRPIYFMFPEPDRQPGFAERKFSVIIAAIYKQESDPYELYSKRAETVRWFEQNHPNQLDFFGRQDRRTNTHFTNYRGPVQGEKLHVLMQYKFVICYENSYAMPGYISEKTFDAFFAGCIPVYWGPTDVTDYIPKSCFIDRRDFADHEALYAYMNSIDEAKYLEYRRNIDVFLSSDFARSYDGIELVKTLLLVCTGEGQE